MIRLANIVKLLILGSTLASIMGVTSGAAKECCAPDARSQERAFSRAVSTGAVKVVRLAAQTGTSRSPFDDQAAKTGRTAGALLPKSAQAASIAGNYSVTGTNPNGTSYRGSVVIQADGGNRYSFFWRIGSQTFSGNGVLTGNRITVNWGQPSPVIYQVGGDGVLRGTWSNGQATEMLTPQ